jgi:hypothetical protein
MRRRWWIWAAALCLTLLVAAVMVTSSFRQPISRPNRVPSPARRATQLRVPPPLFGKWYVEALRGVRDLEERDAAALEKHLRNQPGDEVARLKLMAYAIRGDQTGSPESRERRARHALFLVDHNPRSEILHSPYSMFLPGQLTDDEYRRAKSLWERAVTANPADARVAWNAAAFYRELDPQRYQEFLAKAVELDTANPHYGRELGLRYAQAVVEVGRAGKLETSAAAVAALRQLDESQSAGVVEAAVRLLQSEYNTSLMFGRENRQMGELARRLFRRAEILNPELDRVWVYPQLDPKLVGSMAPGAASRPSDDWVREAEKLVRRLGVEAFPELPEIVADTLVQRGCRIPQGRHEAERANVVRGEFFAKGQRAWAVLCSAGGYSSILLFRSDTDSTPDELAKAEDKNYFQNEGTGYFYSREIRPVGRDFVVGHYRAYGGPKPPPIDHQGIDDAFLEKASVTHYWHDGKWLRLQGAD